MPDHHLYIARFFRRLTRRLLPAVLILLAACAGTEPKPAQDSVVEDAHVLAEAAYRAGQYSQTLALLGPLAQRGDAEAQYIIGYMYYYGQGVPRNSEVARQWIGQAATQGHAKAGRALTLFHTPSIEIEDTTLMSPGTAPPPPSTKVEPRSVPPVDDANPSPPATSSPAAIDSAPEVSRSQPLPAQPPSAATDQVQTAPNIDPGSVTFAPVDDEPPTQTPAQTQNRPQVQNPPQTRNPEPAQRQPAPWDKPAAANLHANQWIREQPAQSYTIQLLAGKDQQRMTEFIQQNDIADQAAYFQLSRDGESWYGVIYGSYPGYSLAQAAMKQMKPALLKHSPWIREFSGIQGVLSP